MSNTLKVICQDSQGQLRRLPASRYLNRELQVPEFANQVIQCAEVMVETKNRKTVRVLHAWFPLQVFDAAGRMDEKSWQLRLRLAVNMMGDERQKQVADAMRGHSEYFWVPTPSQQEIIKAVALA